MALRINTRSYHIGTLLHVREKESGANTGLDMHPGAQVEVWRGWGLDLDFRVDGGR